MIVRLLAVLVVLYAAVLRLDAVTLMHGPVDAPQWLQSLQSSRPAVSALRPPTMTWQRWEGRYISDPYTYLQYAREPRGFYDAHRREPVFVFATRAWLWLLGNQDRAVSWASAMFSVLAVWATYLLGRRAWSPWVGVLAALAMAIEMENITWGVGGWRDDAFTCVVVLTAHAVLWLRASPTMGRAIWLGVICALACLTRITSLSFVVPALVATWWLLPSEVTERRRLLLTAVGVFVLLLSPYLINCWRVYGDPLYAINVHADVYREAEGQQVQTHQTASEYLTGLLREQPMRTIDTAVLGMTAYPFANKWGGFAPWHPWLGPALMWLSVIGLVGMLASAPGRLVLIVLAASLVPYALTWRLIGDWRFTMHAYPFLLLAAALPLVSLATVMHPEWWRARRREWPPERRWWITRGAVAVTLVGGVWWSTVPLPAAVARETLRDERVVTVSAGARDRAFFVEGWQGPRVDGNVTSRVTSGASGRLRLPVAAGAPWELLLRMDPAPPPAGDAPLPVVRLFVDGQPAGRVELIWDPLRIGGYVVPMPVSLRDWVELELLVEPGAARPEALRFWYAQVRLK
jgi:hypothetical protein